jgi:RNA polymerase sigma-70 factor (ECF subfamily)
MGLNAFFNRKKEFEKVTWCFGAQLYRFAFSRLGNRQDAEDVVQETYVRAFRSFHTLAPNSDTRAWLMKILLNVIRDHYSKILRSLPTEPIDESSEETLNESIAPSHARNPEELLLENEIDSGLLQALRSLPGTLLYPLLLREVEDMNYQEIANVLDIPVGTVMSRLFRARQSLRNKLAQNKELPQCENKSSEGALGDDLMKQGKRNDL